MTNSISDQLKDSNLDELLDLVTVEQISTGQVLGEEHGIDGWYAVSNDEGHIAYFGNETDAFAFRLMYINMTLNG